MRNVLVITVALLLAASPASGESGRAQAPGKALATGPLLPLKGPAAANSCATYGPGFVKVAGSDTCVKVGGMLSVGVGGGR